MNYVDYEGPHLTHVERIGTSLWEATCDCSWRTTEPKKNEAVKAAEMHWLAMPLVVGESNDEDRAGPRAVTG